MVRSSVIRLSGRIPTIQFRKGGLVGSHGQPQPAATITPAGGQRLTAMSTGVIEDHQLPKRYKRAPLTPEEIEYINGGGIV